MFLQKEKGFTLIELLVVMSIIGLLASIVGTSLGSAKIKARIAAAQRTMEGLQPVLHVCLSSDLAIAAPTPTPDPAAPTTVICAGGPTYPPLTGGWRYCDSISGNGVCGTTISTQTTGVSYSISSFGDATTITCTQTSCTTTP